MTNASSWGYCRVVEFLCVIFLWGVEGKRKSMTLSLSLHSGEVKEGGKKNPNKWVSEQPV